MHRYRAILGGQADGVVAAVHLQGTAVAPGSLARRGAARPAATRQPRRRDPAPRPAGTDLHALGWHTPASRAYMAEMRKGVTQALSTRDGAFGDYRTGDKAKGDAS